MYLQLTNRPAGLSRESGTGLYAHYIISPWVQERGPVSVTPTVPDQYRDSYAAVCLPGPSDRSLSLAVLIGDDTPLRRA